MRGNILECAPEAPIGVLTSGFIFLGLRSRASLCTEATSVTPQGVHYPNTPGIWTLYYHGGRKFKRLNSTRPLTPDSMEPYDRRNGTEALAPNAPRAKLPAPKEVRDIEKAAGSVGNSMLSAAHNAAVRC